MPGYWLASRGFPVEILCQGNPGYMVISTPLGNAPVRSLGLGSIRFSFALFCALLKARSHSGTVFLVHGHVCTPAAWGALVGVNRRRVIYYTQDFLEPGSHPAWECFERRFARRAEWVFSNEVNRARALTSFYGLSRMPLVVPTFLPKSWTVPTRDPSLRQILMRKMGLGPREPCRLIMHEGPFGQLRCGRELVEALALLPKHFGLIFTGMSPAAASTRELHGLAAIHGLMNRILVLDRLSFDELLRHTACCDIGALLYANDGIGNFYQCPGRLTHYLRCGLPVVASSFPGLTASVEQNHLGAVCDSTSPAAISHAIAKVIEREQSELQGRREHIINAALNELSYDKYADQIEAVVAQAFGRNIVRR